LRKAIGGKAMGILAIRADERVKDVRSVMFLVISFADNGSLTTKLFAVNVVSQLRCLQSKVFLFEGYKLS